MMDAPHGWLHTSAAEHQAVLMSVSETERAVRRRSQVASASRRALLLAGSDPGVAAGGALGMKHMHVVGKLEPNVFHYLGISQFLLPHPRPLPHGARNTPRHVVIVHSPRASSWYHGVWGTDTIADMTTGYQDFV